MHHRLGFELPERAGFGGLWSAIDACGADEDGAPAAATSVEEPRSFVTRSHGPTEPAVRRRIRVLESSLTAAA